MLVIYSPPPLPVLGIIVLTEMPRQLWDKALGARTVECGG